MRPWSKRLDVIPSSGRTSLIYFQDADEEAGGGGEGINKRFAEFSAWTPNKAYSFNYTKKDSLLLNNNRIANMVDFSAMSKNLESFQISC